MSIEDTRFSMDMLVGLPVNDIADLFAKTVI
jgi:hypothetical protein